MTITEEIRERLFQLQDEKYRDFQSKLIPNLEASVMIGVRTPELRKLSREMVRRENIGEFLDELPHRYFDENQLHAFILSEIRDYDRCVEAVCRFLPYVDNWATCDQMSPKVFRRNRQALLPHIREWIESGKTYTVRFGIGMLMSHFLDEGFDQTYAETVASIRSEEYYVNMMIAWYFATALVGHYEEILPFLEEKRLDPWTHNKAIQKAIESYRITEEQKAYLRTLRISAGREKQKRSAE